MAKDSAEARYVAYELQEDLPKGTILFIRGSGEDIRVMVVKKSRFFSDPNSVSDIDLGG